MSTSDLARNDAKALVIQETPHNEDELLEQLLVRYLEQAEAGSAPSIETICSDRPDLMPALRELVGLAGVLPEDSGTLLGRTLADRYELTGRLGAGGMGLVFTARDKRLDRDVAVKVLDDLFQGNEERIERFRREAQSLAALKNPHIIAVHDVSVTTQPSFLVMDLIDGCDLAGFVRALAEQVPPATMPDTATVLATASDKMPEGAKLGELFQKPWPELVARLGLQMCHALEAAHGAGVVHRDVKPSNFMLDAEGTLHLLDFGLARRERDPRLTQDKTSVGTPLYMSPEQVRGGEVDTASDIYSLGATLYELVCLRPPFDGSGHGLANQILFEEPVAPRRLQPRLLEDLEAVCLKCLHKQPGQRYGSAVELTEDLERFLRHEPVLAKPRILPEPLRRALGTWRRHRPPTPALVAGIVVVGLSIWGLTNLVSTRAASTAVEMDLELRQLLARIPPTAGVGGTKESRLKDPTRAATISLLDRILQLRHDEPEAKLLRRAFDIDEGHKVEPPGDAIHRAWNLLRNRRTQEGAVTEAIHVLGKPNAPTPLELRVRMLARAELGHLDRLLALAVELERLRGTTALTAWARGLVGVSFGQWTQATLDHYLTADRLAPGDPSTLHNISKIYRRTYRPKEALPYIRKAMRSAPKHPNYAHELALVLIKLDEYEEAETVLAGMPESVWYKRDFERARMSFRRAMRSLDPVAGLHEALDEFRAIGTGRHRGEQRLPAGFVRELETSITQVAALVNGTDPGNFVPFLLDDPLDPTLLRNLGNAVLQRTDATREDRDRGRLLLLQALVLNPAELRAVVPLARSYRDDDPEQGLRTLLRWLNRGNVPADARELIGALIRRLPRRKRSSWERTMRQAGLVQ